MIGAVISSGRATLHECQTIYGLEDVYDMLEIVQVDRYNESLVIKAAEQE